MNILSKIEKYNLNPMSFLFILKNLDYKRMDKRSEKLIGVAPPLLSTVEDTSDNVNEI